MSNKELLMQGYQHFAEGNMEAVLAMFDPQIEWNECKGFPFVKGDGTSIGPQAVVEDVFSQIPVHYDGFSIDIQDLFESGDKVVMEGYYTGVWKATGKQFKANATHIWTIRNGLATRFFQAVDTASIIN
jgi:ketosteroid isomerase-like protein